MATGRVSVNRIKLIEKLEAKRDELQAQAKADDERDAKRILKNIDKDIETLQKQLAELKKVKRSGKVQDKYPSSYERNVDLINQDIELLKMSEDENVPVTANNQWGRWF